MMKMICFPGQDVDTMQQSRNKSTINTVATLNFKLNQSRKMMAVVFWDEKGVRCWKLESDNARQIQDFRRELFDYRFDNGLKTERTQKRSCELVLCRGFEETGTAPRKMFRNEPRLCEAVQ